MVPPPEMNQEQLLGCTGVLASVGVSCADDL